MMIQSIHMQNRQKLSEIALASPAKVDLEAQTLVADTQSRAVSTFSGPFTGISCRPCKN